MTVSVLNRMVAAVGIGAVSLFGLSVPTNAQPPPQKDKQQQLDQKEKKQQKEEKRARQEQDKRQQARVAQQQQQVREQQRLIGQQQQRLVQYGDYLDQQQRVAHQQSVELQRQNRGAQYSYQQQYMADLRQQQLRIRSQGNYDYGGDPFFYTAPSYRYSRGGRYYQTNQYGVDLLRQAVNYGYEQGRLAGLADRQDHWASNYSISYAYQDANYGYGGFYVDRNDYNNYFRQGFRRGYQDGYSGSYQYGSYSNGRGTILAGVLAAILTFEAIR